MVRLGRRLVVPLVGILGALACNAPRAEPVAVPVSPGAPAASESSAAAPTDASAPLTFGLFETQMKGWTMKSACSGLDYFPRGGIQSFWCHRPPELTVAAVSARAGVPIFASGPHSGDALELKSTGDFGHYNPAFVRWLSDNVTPPARGTPQQLATQKAYDLAFRPLVDVFWKTLAKLRREQACFAREKSSYETAIHKQTLPPGYYERWFFFMNPFFCDRASSSTSTDSFYFDNGYDGGVDGNVTKSVVGFWMRRAIDGTMPGFADALKKVVLSYEPELVSAPGRAPDTASLLRALDGATKAASACRAPAGQSGSVPVYIVFGTDGAVTSARAAPVGLSGTTVASCVESKFSALKVPPFEGSELHFTRTVPVR
jgi:hypothetical protein